MSATPPNRPIPPPAKTARKLPVRQSQARDPVEAEFVAEVGGEEIATTAILADVLPQQSDPIEASSSIEETPATTARTIGPPVGILRRTMRGIGSLCEWCFGVVSLLLGLAVLATLPVLNLLSLGYLLEAGGRVARSGRLRDGVFGVRQAARLGGMALGAWLVLRPAWLVGELWYSAKLIAPGESVARGWGVALVVLWLLTVAHVAWACLRGGRLRHFCWPAPVRLIRTVWRGGMYARARDAVWEFVVGLRLPYYFWLGLRGLVGAIVWLILPVSLMIAGSRLPPGAGALVAGVGGLLLMAVLLYLPFLQTNFAATGRWRTMFDVGAVRGLFRRAPLAFWSALFVTLLFALPLYLLKIELTPREVTWLPSLAFVLFIFPARLLEGWAVGRGRRQERPRFFLVRWLSRLAMLPAVAIYVLIVYATQYLSWYGPASLLEQHAFLVPAPFLGF